MAEEPCIRVNVQTLSGKSAQIEVPASCNTLELKEKLLQPLQVPVLCQRLLLNSQALDDEELLSSHGLDSLSLDLLVQTNSLHEILEDRKTERTLPALQALDWLDPTDEQSIDILERAVSWRCPKPKKKCHWHIKGSTNQKKWEESVREIAFKMLTRQAGCNNMYAFETLCHLLTSERAKIREWAIEAIAQSTLGNKNASDRLCTSLDEKITYRGRQKKRRRRIDNIPGYVVTARLEALGRITSEDNTEALDAVLGALRKERLDKSIDVAAVACMTPVLKAGGTLAAHVVRDSFLSCLQRVIATDRAQHDVTIFKAAVRRMSAFLDRNDEVLMAKCEELLRGDRACNSCAVDLLPAFVEKGNPAVISMLTKHLREGLLAHHRAAAATALGRVASTADDKVVALLIDAFKDGAEVVQAAIRALGQVAEPGMQYAIDALLACLQHPDGWVKRAVPGPLARLISKSDETEAVAALVECTQSIDTEVAEAALHALASLTPTVFDTCFNAACSCLEHRDSHLRKTAVKVLVNMGKASSDDGCGHGIAAKIIIDDGRIVAALAAAACPASWWDEDEEVSKVILQGLGELVKEGNDFAMDALRKFTSDPTSKKLAEQAEKILKPAESTRKSVRGYYWDSLDSDSEEEPQENMDKKKKKKKKSWTRQVQKFAVEDSEGGESE